MSAALEHLRGPKTSLLALVRRLNRLLPMSTGTMSHLHRRSSLAQTKSCPAVELGSRPLRLGLRGLHQRLGLGIQRRAG